MSHKGIHWRVAHVVPAGVRVLGNVYYKWKKARHPWFIATLNPISTWSKHQEGYRTLWPCLRNYPKLHLHLCVPGTSGSSKLQLCYKTKDLPRWPNRLLTEFKTNLSSLTSRNKVQNGSAGWLGRRWWHLRFTNGCKSAIGSSWCSICGSWSQLGKWCWVPSSPTVKLKPCLSYSVPSLLAWSFHKSHLFHLQWLTMLSWFLWLPVRLYHQQQLWFPSETPGSSRRLWRLWRNLLPFDRELNATRRPGDGSHCIRTSFTLWWRLRNIRRSRVLHSSQGLHLCWRGLHNTWRCWIMPTTYCSTIFKTDVFSLYSHLCIYRATYLHMLYLDWQHVVIVSNSRCTWRWRSSELRDTLQGHDRASLGMHLWQAMIERDWRSTWRWSIWRRSMGGAPGAETLFRG